jgi:hypothetical protein
MRYIDTNMFFIFVSGSAFLLVLLIRPQRVTGEYLSEDAPTQFVPMSEPQATPAVSALDPRVDPQTDVSAEPVPQE